MTPQRKTSAAWAALGLSAAFAALPVHASLVLQGPENFSGTGLGAVNTILTMQSPGNSTFETGSVGLAPGGATVITGDALTGASQTLTRTLGAVGVTSAAELRVVFNANEPSSAAERSILLENLVLNIFSPTGSLLFTSGAFAPVNFADTFSGIGNSGYIFALDPAQAAQAQSLAFGAGFSNNLIGLSATASAAQGGPETFFVANAPIPEPGTWAMALAGLAGLALKIGQRARRDA